MISVAISVEGQTEEEFIKSIISPHLETQGISITANLIGFRGGAVSLKRINKDLRSIYYQERYDFITTFYDFYGFKKRPNGDVDAVELAIKENLKKSVGSNFREDKVFPYVQMHEYEALLFADSSKFKCLPDVTEIHTTKLSQIAKAFTTPEDINDSVHTAPSKRISAEIPDYDKVLYGNCIALEIGLEKIRQECPRFNGWLRRLENLAQ